jgi:SAM-dependent methyltransferase
MRVTDWRCPACGSGRGHQRFVVPAEGTEAGVDPGAFRPSADGYGSVLGGVIQCDVCGHGSIGGRPRVDDVRRAYEDAADPVSLREEAGQVETARRALVELETFVPPGTIYDVGCWTGSFLVAAQDRGWHALGVEPSRWASERARARGLDVRTASLDDHGLPAGQAQVVVMCDVLEHLLDPEDAVRVIGDLLAPGGALYITVPDAGSVLARIMGRRWWSVLPMHVQYFSRRSLRRLLEANGFHVRAMRTHPKVFSVRYYLERIGGYSPAASRALVALVAKTGQAERLMAPDFRDRVAVIATKD